MNKQKKPEKTVLGREKQFFGKAEAENSDEEELVDMECPNCHDMIPADQTVAHTVQCYRASTKCKICGEVILKEKKKEHLEYWRSIAGL